MTTKSLQSVSYFKNLAEADFRELKNMVQIKTLVRGEILIEQGSEDKNIYYIEKGLVRVFRTQVDGSAVPFSIIGKGEFVGEMSILDGGPRSATVEALEETKVLMFDHRPFLIFLEKHPDILVALLKTAVTRLRDIHKKIEEAASLPLVDRTWNSLQILSVHFPKKMIPLSHEELADIIGATRARVSEALEALHKEGKINLSYRAITII
ncbi:MAG: Crp/Fnr family transcriptional regulator [Patescibacteria group bacterium]|jgi:CRP-like cAMP-binding protein